VAKAAKNKNRKILKDPIKKRSFLFYPMKPTKLINNKNTPKININRYISSIAIYYLYNLYIITNENPIGLK
jgi:hypothetical protein